MESIDRQIEILKRNTLSFISEEEFREKLKLNRPLRIKLGVDPSRPDLHLGHAVVLRKLREFQRLGHQVILIIGDFTARIGDPTGRSKTRPMLSKEEAMENARTYSTQAFKILDPEHTEIRFNSEWLDKMGFEEVIRLSAKYTVARMLERNDFDKRLKNNEPVSVSEFLYPLAQAYDSVEVKADVEIGGDDQFFNFVVARKIQEEYGLPPQAILTVPLIEGTDGNLKMSKSYDNYVAFEDTPTDMFGKLMSIPDTLIVKYAKLLTDASNEDIKKIEEQLEDKSINPRDIKLELARTITAEYHGAEVGESARQNFINVFSKKQNPDEMPEISLKKEEIKLIDLMVDHLGIKSRSEARRLVSQGGVKLNDRVIDDIHLLMTFSDGDIIRIGKKRFYRIKSI